MSDPSTDDLPAAAWFEMPEVRRRRLANSVWIPLRQLETLHKTGPEGRVGAREEFLSVGSVAFHLDHRAAADNLDWSDIGAMHEAKPHAFRDGRYKPVDVFLWDDTDELGVELVFVQHYNSDHPTGWHVSQDLTMALNLVEEGDVWRAVDEGYVDVIRSRKDDEGKMAAIEIRAEFLRDYLAARKLALRVGLYRQRVAIVKDASYLPWAKDGMQASAEHDRFECRVFETDATGDPFGSGTFAVFHSWRTDVDNDEDVPVFGPETDENTASRSATFEKKGDVAYRVEGELWREEWVEPAERSVRVRGDAPAEEYFYTVDAGGERLPASKMNYEEVGRYLWFHSAVVSSLLGHRGAGLVWHSRDTGSVRCSPGNGVHFGINREGLINAYAYDIAKLPQWQQRIWSGHNVSPEGAVSSELLDSQQRTRPAATRAPEKTFGKLLAALNAVFMREHGGPLFRHHDSTAEILTRVHRFRGIEAGGLLALAKDIARLTADSIDAGVLRRVLAPPQEESWRSLRHLEKVLATKVEAAAARSALTALAGIYELRLGDAHLPSDDIEAAYKLVGVDRSDSLLKQAEDLISAADDSLVSILKIVGP